MNMNARFDPADEQLKLFLKANTKRLEARAKKLENEVYQPLYRIPRGRLPRNRSFAVLSDCANLALSRLAQICSTQSMDFWLAYVRRLPNHIPAEWRPEWLAYATLAIVKWSCEKDTTLGQVQNGNVHGVAFAVTEDDFLACTDIAVFSRLLANINNLRRWVGKGAALKSAGGRNIDMDVPDDVEQAVRIYDLRSPASAILAFHAVHHEDRPTTDGLTIVTPSSVKPPHNCFNLTKIGESFRFQYLPFPSDATSLVRLVEPYAHAIELEHDIRLNAVWQTLVSFGVHLFREFPESGPEGDAPEAMFVFEQDPSDESFAASFSFVLSCCRRGFVRFPEQHFRERLGETAVVPYSHSAEEARSQVDSFFRAFLLSPVSKEHREIDVERLSPFPILYSSPGGNCYFDFLWTFDWLAWLIRDARGRFEKFHGNLFEASLERAILRSTEGVQVLPRLGLIKSSAGEQAQIDLLLHDGSEILIVECKAYEKSRAFWLGEPNAANARNRDVRDAVEQVKKEVRVLEDVIASGAIEIPSFKSIQWVVCTPSQEYLKPIDVHGMLLGDIPRICTPEELIRYLNRNRQ